MAKMKEVELAHREFLSKSENFKVAAEVFDHFEEVRIYLQEKYWTAVKRLIESHRLSREFGKWKVTDDDGVPAEKGLWHCFRSSRAKIFPLLRSIFAARRTRPSFPGKLWNCLESR